MLPRAKSCRDLREIYHFRQYTETEISMSFQTQGDAFIHWLDGAVATIGESWWYIGMSELRSQMTLWAATKLFGTSHRIG